MNLTTHAKTRSQQRGIPLILIDLLDKFGAEERASDGAQILFFDKAARRKLRAYLGTLANAIDQFSDIYLVRVDDKIITVGYRLTHIRRH